MAEQITIYVDKFSLDETSYLYDGIDGYALSKSLGFTELSFEQWLLIRTEEFKTKFGDWETRKNRFFLDSEAVSKVVDIEFPDFNSTKELIDYFGAFYSQTIDNIVVHPELGEIVVNRRSVKDSLSHGFNDDKKKGLWLLPSALGKSAILDRLGEKDGKKGYALGAPVEIDGERFILSCLVRRVPNSQRLYVYELDAEKELRAPSTDASAKNKFLVELNSGQPGTINNVLHKLYAVNPLRENISIPLNQQTGEPATEFVSKIEIVITQGLINVSELYPRDAARKLYDTVGGDLSQRKRLTRSAAEAGLRIDFRAVDEAIAQGRPATTVKDLFLKAMTLDPSKQQSPKNNVKKGKTK